MRFRNKSKKREFVKKALDISHRECIELEKYDKTIDEYYELSLKEKWWSELIDLEIIYAEKYRGPRESFNDNFYKQLLKEKILFAEVNYYKSILEEAAYKKEIDMQEKEEIFKIKLPTVDGRQRK